MSRWCIVNPDTKEVINICEWDGNTDTWSPPKDVLMIPAPDDTNAGDILEDEKNGTFTRPEPLPEKLPEKTDVEKLQDILIAKGVIAADDLETAKIKG